MMIYIKNTQSNRILLLIVVIAFSTSTTIGQKMVSAKTIMQDIKKGNEITYENFTIVGELDFTFLEDRNVAYTWWNRYWNGKFEKRGVIKENTISPISFTNCIFEDDVLAYIRLDMQNHTLIANFADTIVFKNCIFRGKAMFKHSDFASFTSFSGSSFYSSSTFKYAEFNEFANFSNTQFERHATFRYTKFNKGVNFNKAIFIESLDIGHIMVKGNLNTDSLLVGEEIDATYADINGKNMLTYLFSNK